MKVQGTLEACGPRKGAIRRGDGLKARWKRAIPGKGAIPGNDPRGDGSSYEAEDRGYINFAG